MTTAIGGVWLVTLAVIGYFTRPLAAVTRVLLAAGGFALLIPANVIPSGFWVDLGGFALGAALIARELAIGRRPVPTKPVA